MIKERRYSRGRNAFYNPKGQLSIMDFVCDENGMVRLGWEDADPAYVPKLRYIGAQTSRRWLGMEETNDTFPLGYIANEPHGTNRKSKTVRYNRSTKTEIWYMYGFRVRIEFYDTNALMEVLNRFPDETNTRDEAIGKIIRDANMKGLSASFVGDKQFINITEHEI